MSEFKHISVTAADEDDEVIIAGMAEEPAEASAAEAAPEIVQVADPMLEPSKVAEPEPIRAGDASAEPDGGPGSAAARPPARAKRPAKGEDAYHETTLADLEGGGMPLIQRIVIIAAVVCIIGALVYYFVALR